MLLAFQDKNRVDQVVRGQGVFTHHAAGKIILAHAAWAAEGKRALNRGITHGDSRGVRVAVHLSD
ncbi:hypothetical protein GCM10007421_21660 [Halopseudomonas oceani]|nr:hypothetical protein GCM10007421_21660 [Halopseudomonas oceani]